MEHKESSLMIYHSTEYGRFKMIEGNRQLNESKINKIKADIEAGIDVLKYYPIQVFERDDKLEIKDGQHRFYIARSLKRAVHYIIMRDDRGLTDIAKINSNVEKWKTRDFINCYLQQGNEHYKALDDFMERYGLSATLAIKLLSKGNVGTEPGGGYSVADSFQRGLFKVEFQKKAEDLTTACKQFESFKHWKSAAFFTAIEKILKYGAVKISDVFTKYDERKEGLTKQPGYKEYIGNLEMLYNRDKNKRVIIYQDK